MKHKVGNLSSVIRLSVIAAIGGFLFGFDSGVINGTVGGLQTAFNSDRIGTGFNVASMLLGCAVGAFIAGQLADRWGRRKVMSLAAALFLLSAWGSGISDTSSEFVLYRIIGGLAVGAASIICPAYISEIAPSQVRGSLATLQQIAIISGLFASFLSNYTVANVAGSSLDVWLWGYEAWRWMFWAEIIPASAFGLLLLTIPESPRYLVSSKRDAEAMSVLEQVGEEHPTQKIEAIRVSIENHSSPALSDCLDSARLLKPIIWIGISMAVLQQISGINVVFYYGAILWQSVGFTESDALLINVASGGISILACLIAVALVDRVGRRPLLLVGSTGMALSLTVVSATFLGGALDQSGQLLLAPSQGITALVAANAFVFCFNFSWGPIMWVLLGEMFPNALRGSALALAGLAQWTANFAVTMTFPIFLESIGLAITYGIYAIGAGMSLIFVLRYVGESRGLDLEQMSEGRVGL
jgi:SP family sugar:H+ symporter-like MFS transporter